MTYSDWIANLSVPGLAALVALLLGVGAVASVALRVWLRRRERRDDAAAAAAPTASRRTRWWMSRSLRDCAPPLVLFIWLHALFAVLTLLVQRMPPEWRDAGILAVEWAYRSAIVITFFWLLTRVGLIAEALLLAASRGAGTAWDAVMRPVIGKALRRLLPLMALAVGISIVPLAPGLEHAARQVAMLVFIGVGAWLLFQVVGVAGALILRRYPIAVGDNLHARGVHTQVVVLQKVVNTVISVFTVASMLMVFDSARQFGASLLASAGIAGIVVGLAAQRSIATLLAGFQIALTQPIRVDDVVIVEGEWGQVEDITLTYVVVRIWDQRRLIVPMTYFIEQPFQNWTRASAEILGIVFLHVDYSMPIPALRAELTRILRESPYWDGRVNVLQVTEAKEHSLELRALTSAANASVAWDLRCEVREKLVEFIQQRHPGALPRVRATVGTMAESVSAVRIHDE
jgi:small-conductance mechanosensitive channel